MKQAIMMVVAALTFATFAQAPENGPDRPRRFGGMGGEMMIDPLVMAIRNPKVAEKLSLTDEQSAKIKDVFNDQEAMKGMYEKVRKATEKQMELLKADQIDEAAVMGAIDEVADARKEVQKAGVKKLIAIKAILTPEQIAKAREEIKNAFPRREGMRRGPDGEHK